MREDSFSYKQLDALPLGSVIESPVNYDVMTGGKWLLLGGQYVYRSKVDPKISAAFPFGFPTFTVRTLAATPAIAGPVVSTPTYFVAPGAYGVASIQYSTDGATWSQTSVVTPNGATYGLLWAGSRLFRMSTSAEGIQYTSGDNPGSTWTSVSGSFPAGYGGYVQAAYSPTLGRSVFPNAATNTTIYTVDDGGGVSTARTKTSSRVASVCWTGKRFIARSVSAMLLHYSNDGITWTDAVAPFSAVGADTMASDGNGTVVICPTTTPYPMQVSKDHGDSWVSVAPTPEMFSSGYADKPISTYGPAKVMFSGGWFVLTPIGGGYWIAVSRNGIDWELMFPAYAVTSGSVSSLGGVAVKDGVWAWVGEAATGYSFTVDYSKLRLPFPMRSYNISSSLHIGNQWPQWLKVRN